MAFFKHRRISTLEEKKNLKSAYIYIILTVFIVVFFIIFGIPLLSRMTNFISDMKRSNEPITKEDTTPPAPPKSDFLPEATNKENLEIKGSVEPSVLVTLFINEEKLETTSDKDGRFSFNITLARGENNISLRAKDEGGNESTASEEYIVIYDDKEPDLEIISPPDGKTFSGTLQRQVVIEGKTEEGAKITINDRLVVVEEDGSFTFATTLQEGGNNFNIKSVDKAGNETTKGITLQYWK